MIDVEALTRALPEDRPCGDNLEYDPEFQALEVASRRKPEQQFGGRNGKVIPAEEPAWDDVERRAQALSERTRDLRVAVLLARALVHTAGLGGVAPGLQLIAGLVRQLWDDVHPQLDPSDDNDPSVRINVLAALVDPEGFLCDIRTAEFVSDPRQGRCTVRQLEVALGLVEHGADEPIVPREQIETLVRQAAAEGMPNHAQLALDSAQQLSRTLIEQLGTEQALDLAPLLRRLRPIANFYSQVVPEAAALDAAADPLCGASLENSAGPANAGVAGAAASLREIRSREDVADLLARVCEFLERTEPTNPAPLLIRRAQRLMTMSFVDILRDVAPEGVPAISKIAGLPVETK